MVESLDYLSPNRSLPHLDHYSTVAKGIILCNQHIHLVIRIEFLPKHYPVTLPLNRKKKLPKCQELPIISAGG